MASSISFKPVLIVLLMALSTGIGAATPAFDCKKASGNVERLVCGDDELAALDRKMAEVFAAAAKKAANELPPILKAEQRGWIKGRNDCSKSSDVRACVSDEYKRRIAELQARYRLVPMKGPFFFACDGNPANELVATFFETNPEVMIAERGYQVSLMYAQPAASGARYQGGNESFWEHQGEARVVWGYGAPEMRCTQKSAC
jgi:uncharacterized protein